MNLPNKLTVSRFALTVAFLAVMFSRVRFHETIALVLSHMPAEHAGMRGQRVWAPGESLASGP